MVSIKAGLPQRELIDMKAELQEYTFTVPLATDKEA